MGCTTEQGSDCRSDESPSHSVTVSHFYMGEHEVTVKQYMEFCTATGSNYPLWLESGNEYNVETGTDTNYKDRGYARYGSESLPIVGVSWHDANAYCDWITRKTGRKYRLPTEAEWEYAARGGIHKEGYKYSGGSNLYDEGWYNENSRERPNPVKRKNKNKLGLYDMSGNVSEWCQDWYGDYSSSAQRNPTGSSSGVRRILRGGAGYDDARDCRVSYRSNSTPNHRENYYGIRLVSTVH